MTNVEFTSDVVRSATFREKLKGYNPEDVHAFMERSAAAIDQLTARLAEASARALKAEAALASNSEADESVRRTLVLAQRTAEMAVREANEEAATIRAEARRDSDQALAEARVGAERCEAEAAERAGRLTAGAEQARAEAEAHASAVTAQADAHAAAVTGDAEARAAAITAEAEARVSHLDEVVAAEAATRRSEAFATIDRETADARAEVEASLAELGRQRDQLWADAEALSGYLAAERARVLEALQGAVDHFGETLEPAPLPDVERPQPVAEAPEPDPARLGSEQDQHAVAPVASGDEPEEALNLYGWARGPVTWQSELEQQHQPDSPTEAPAAETHDAPDPWAAHQAGDGDGHASWATSRGASEATDPWATPPSTPTADPWGTSVPTPTADQDPWATPERGNGDGHDPWATPERGNGDGHDPWATGAPAPGADHDPWATAEPAADHDAWETAEPAASAADDPWAIRQGTHEGHDPWATPDRGNGDGHDPWATAAPAPGADHDPWATSEPAAGDGHDPWAASPPQPAAWAPGDETGWRRAATAEPGWAAQDHHDAAAGDADRAWPPVPATQHEAPWGQPVDSNYQQGWGAGEAAEQPAWEWPGRSTVTPDVGPAATWFAPEAGAAHEEPVAWSPQPWDRTAATPGSADPWRQDEESWPSQPTTWSGWAEGTAESPAPGAAWTGADQPRGGWSHAGVEQHDHGAADDGSPTRLMFTLGDEARKAAATPTDPEPAPKPKKNLLGRLKG